MMKLWRSMLVPALLLVMSLAMATTIVRLPVLWSLVPGWWDRALISLTNLETQEGIADLELLSAWLWCLGLVTLVYAIAARIRHFSGGKDH